MAYDFDPKGETHGLKIGRSSDPQERTRQLIFGHNFKMVVVATFPGKGYLEPIVQHRLAGYRSNRGIGREWFGVSVEKALEVIADLIHT